MWCSLGFWLLPWPQATWPQMRGLTSWTAPDLRMHIHRSSWVKRQSLQKQHNAPLCHVPKLRMSKVAISNEPRDQPTLSHDGRDFFEPLTTYEGTSPQSKHPHLGECRLTLRLGGNVWLVFAGICQCSKHRVLDVGIVWCDV